MTIYTTMPLEVVLEGWSADPEPMLEVEYGPMRLLVAPVAPGVGKLVRLLSAPLDAYLQPAFEPGRLIYFGAAEQRVTDRPASISGGEWGL